MKEKIYIDFDGTLNDSDKLYNDFIKICKGFGITEKQVQEEGKKLFKSKNLFDIDIFSKYLLKEYNLSLDFIEKIESLLSNSYLYQDVIPALKRIQETNKYELIILTLGSEGYQKKKILSSNINPYISEIIVTSSVKTNLPNVDYRNGIFIDNNPFQIDELCSIEPKRVIRIRRKSDKYSTKNSKYFVHEYDNFIALIEQEKLV